VQGKTERAFQARFTASLISLVILGLASYHALRLGVADQHYRSNTLSSVTRAAELDPGNAGAWLWLAEHQEHAGLDSTAALQTAARLNPYNSAPLIRLGLRVELSGNLNLAEKLLLQAARVDRLYEPRWSLVNFYFRTGSEEMFWLWVRAALDMGYGDLSPLYQLCWRVTGDPALIMRNIPTRRPVLAGYLQFLLANNRSAAAAPVAQQLTPLATPGELPLLLGYIDQSLDATLWNALCERRLLPYSPGTILTNADFRNPPLLHGFDWRVTNTADIAATRTAPSGIRITLSGRQPESCELLSQPIPLAAGRRYRFRFDYQTTHIAPNTGLRWSIGDRSTRDLSSEALKSEVLEFIAGGSNGRLALTCQRVLGAVRIEGTIALGNLALDPLD
jgi:hypothetical protein